MAESPTPVQTAKTVPIDTSTFVLGGYQHDQTTLSGRITHNFYSTSPLLMFNSSKSIETAAELLSQYKINPEQIRNQIGDSKLWTAQTLVRASTNADTQEIIPLPFRLCGFVTFNMPILIGLCLPNAGLPMMMGMQWANTTHNGAINFYNRNASNPTDPVLLGSSYTVVRAKGSF